MSYNDDGEYLDFLLRNKVLITTEDFQKADRLPITAVNNHDWHSIGETYKKDKVVVIDDFLDPACAERLRKFFLFFNNIDDYYPDYGAINLSKGSSQIWFPLLTNITEECKERMPFLGDRQFDRGWAFIYNNESGGVPVHADPAAINLNFWVTPDSGMNLKEGFNGLEIWKIYPPADWAYENYNSRRPDSANRVASFLSENAPSRVSIEYKFNRVVIFDSMFFHKSNPVSSKPGYENRRINYTFLYK
jgi:hypothetical protein